MDVRVAVIGGTGVGERLTKLGGTPLFVPTSEGTLRGRVARFRDTNIYVVSRHSAGHKVPPHKVPYAAIATGLKHLGVQGCFATAAVGSMRPEWGTGTLVAVSDFLDLSFRNLTLFNRTVVHRDFSEPFSSALREVMLRVAAEKGLAIQREGVYLNGNGPRFETPDEIRAYRTLGGDLVGMTAASEATLMREAGVPYACLAIVTNLAAGLSEAPLAHGDVTRAMASRGAEVLELLLEAAVKVANV